jgi:hypothetical protein
MNKAKWVSATAGAAMIAATLALPTAGVAYASGNGNVTGNGNISILSGNSVTAPISVPVNLCGVSLGLIGFANSGCQGGATSNVSTQGGGNGGGGNGGNGNVVGNGNVSAVAGNTITAPISAPVNLCSISLALLGFGNSGCQGGATTNVTTAQQGSNGNVTGIGNVGLGSGNTITAPISAPVNVCSVSVAVAGFANSGCQGGAEVNPPSCHGDDCTPPSCHGDDCTPPSCHGDDCTPCQGQMCHCHGDDCNPGCHGSDCNPGCHGSDCNPGCHGRDCTPPGNCHSNCTPGGGGNPNGGTPNGTNPGTTTVTNATGPVSGGLPTTGADLLLLGVAAIGTVGVGAGAVTLTRRRRSGTAS